MALETGSARQEPRPPGPVPTGRLEENGRWEPTQRVIRKDHQNILQVL